MRLGWKIGLGVGAIVIVLATAQLQKGVLLGAERTTEELRPRGAEAMEPVKVLACRYLSLRGLETITFWSGPDDQAPMVPLGGGEWGFKETAAHCPGRNWLWE